MNKHTTTGLPAMFQGVVPDITTFRNSLSRTSSGTICQTGRSQVHLDQRVFLGDLQSHFALQPQDPEQSDAVWPGNLDIG